MKFVPAGTDGVLFCVWDVRVKDYAVFVKETGHDWPKANFDGMNDFTQTENDPAVNVSWDDAHAFCDWLTKKEQGKEKLNMNQKYRLPKDLEWSRAVGLDESIEGTPEDRSGKVEGVYPWGTQWPPSPGAGNYCGEEIKKEGTSFLFLPNYNDGYPCTSPVGSFHANKYGLFDMGGNVWQLCEDAYNDEHEDWRVRRGASWNCIDSSYMLSSRRDHSSSNERSTIVGFRVVVVVSSDTTPTPTSSTPAPTPMVPITPPPSTSPSVTSAPLASTPFIGPVVGRSWTNSLGMKFVPAGTDSILFCIWDVRVKDYAVFASDTHQNWPKPHFTQTENDPAVQVSWENATDFCDWLTKKEQMEGRLAAKQKYRLPTDTEWSNAVGLQESNEGTPADRDKKIQGIYPWGTHWPPPHAVGNYGGEETKVEHPNWTIIEGYNDGYADTSPVGSFPANSYGLYDMGGNVWQWCEDYYDAKHDWRVLRGGAWDTVDSAHLLLSVRNEAPPGKGSRQDHNGFRVVVEVSP